MGTIRRKLEVNEEFFRDMSGSLLKYVILCVVISELFYGSLLPALSGLLFLKIYIRSEKKRKDELKNIKKDEQFKDALQSFCAAMEAGYSAENALKEVVKDLRQIYKSNTDIVKDFERIVRMSENNISVEDIFVRYTAESGTEDMNNFARVFAMAKRSNGDVLGVIKATMDMITGKTEVRREIMTITAAKKYESSVMKFTPFGILIYLRICSPQYIEALYGNTGGILLMSILLAVYMAAGAAMNRICTITV